MEMRRHQDIIAFKESGQDPVAFHARNLEVAELSAEAWSEMSSTSLSESRPVANNFSTDVTAELNEWNSSFNPTTRSGKVEFGIRRVTINITQICNLHCTYCAAGGDGTYGDPQRKISVEKTLPQLLFFLEKVPAGESFHITFLGGEPLLYPEAIELIGDYVTEFAKSNFVHATFSVVTNGTLLSDHVVEILAKFKTNVSVSLDGPPEINDRTRPQKNGRGSTEAVVAGLKRIISQKSKLGHLTISAVFSKEHFDVESTYNFFKNFEVDAFDFNYSVSCSDPTASLAFANGMKLIANEAFVGGGEPALRKIYLFDRYFELLDSQQQIENHCGSGKSFLMIDSKNQIFGCPWEVNNKSAKLGEDASLNYEALKDLQQPLIARNNCGTCWARYICGGGCMFAHKTKTKTSHEKDINYCVRTRDLLSTGIVLYKKSRANDQENSHAS